MTHRIQHALETFHARVARYIARRPIAVHQGADGSRVWEYPPTSEVLEAAGLHPIMTYVEVRRRYLLTYALQSSQMFPLARTTQGTVAGWCQQPFVVAALAAQDENQVEE